MEAVTLEPRGRDLVDQAKAGDREAFDALLGPLIQPAFRLAFGILHDREAAEDAVQEAAMRAWRKLDQFRDGGQMRPWFLAIVANRCRTTLRGRWWGVLRLETLERPAPGAENSLVNGMDLRRAVDRLKPDKRLALVLHYYLDLPLDEIAQITRTPVGTVKSRIHRAVEELRPQLQIEEVSG